MCGAQMLVPIALSAAGSFINNRIQAKAAQAQFDEQNKAAQMAQEAREAERTRQRAIDEDSYAEILTTMQDVDPSKRAEAARTEAAAPDNSVQQAARRYAPLAKATDEGGEVLGDGAGRLTDRLDRTKKMVDALALLNAQGVTSSSAADRLSRFGANLTNDNSEARRSASVADYEASVPVPQVTASSSPVGDLMLAAGQIAPYAGNITNPFANWDLIGKKGAFAPGVAT